MSDETATATVRQMHRADIPALVEVNREAYPEMAEDNIIWAASHLRSHLRIFPEGQLVAEIDGRIVGGAASLIVDLGPDPLREHTWAGITDSGYFTNHTDQGDTLYGADVYVHPDARGRGVGAALYEARRQLCRRLNLRRILAGGRLWNYRDYPEDISPQEYVERVISGATRDLVLSFQLREGFIVRRVMPHYLRDGRSRNYSSLIEWINPDYQPEPPQARKVRISCVQYQMRKIQSYEQFAEQVAYFVDIAADYGSDFVLLPELLTVQLLSITKTLSPEEGMRRLADYEERIFETFRDLARRYDITLIGGSTPVRRSGRLLNICPVCLPDGTIVEQPKIHITPNERRWWGISGGNEVPVISTPTARIGVMICYDSEFPEVARLLVDEGAEILFVPYCTDNRQGFLRVRYCCQARAVENQAYVAMAGTVGNIPDVVNMDINYAQAAVFAPSDYAFARDGIVAEGESNEETILVCDLDLDDLHESRNTGTVRPFKDRRLDLFHFSSHLSTRFPKGEAITDSPLGDQPDGSE